MQMHQWVLLVILTGSIENLVKTSHLLSPFPKEMIDTAFFDRFHHYLPGWEIPKMRPEFFTNAYGFFFSGGSPGNEKVTSPEIIPAILNAYLTKLILYHEIHRISREVCSTAFQFGYELYDAIKSAKNSPNDFEQDHLTSFQEVLWGNDNERIKAAADTFYFTNCVS